jgi:hypothetical protein
MAERERDLEAKALDLPTKARARLAERLLASLEGERDADAEALWLEESERRLDEIEAGTVETIPASEAIQKSRSGLR